MKVTARHPAISGVVPATLQKFKKIEQKCTILPQKAWFPILLEPTAANLIVHKIPQMQKSSPSVSDPKRTSCHDYVAVFLLSIDMWRN